MTGIGQEQANAVAPVVKVRKDQESVPVLVVARKGDVLLRDASTIGVEKRAIVA